MEIHTKEITEGIARLRAKLKKIQVDALALSPYNRAYLTKHLVYLDYMLLLHGRILEDALRLKPGFKVLCDYGGGTGLLGLLAKECFDCEVLYVDTYPEACRDVKVIASALNLSIDRVIQGDVNALIRSEGSKPEVMVSLDVVEHIYDLAQFFQKTRESFPEIIQVHNTSANVYNVLKRKYFKKIHHQCEWEGDPDNLKETDHREPFFQLRYDWIQKHYHSINHEATHALAMITRGITFKDMESFVFLWLDGQRHVDPYKDKYLHNTCDPNNGNWAERLLYFHEYERFASGYHCVFKGNPFNLAQKGAGQKLAAQWLNVWINICGKSGKYVWPSFNMLLTPKS
jgi:hypothetical protein